MSLPEIDENHAAGARAVGLAVHDMLRFALYNQRELEKVVSVLFAAAVGIVLDDKAFSARENVAVIKAFHLSFLALKTGYLSQRLYLSALIIAATSLSFAMGMSFCTDFMRFLTYSR